MINPNKTIKGTDVIDRYNKKLVLNFVRNVVSSLSTIVLFFFTMWHLSLWSIAVGAIMLVCFLGLLGAYRDIVGMYEYFLVVWSLYSLVERENINNEPALKELKETNARFIYLFNQFKNSGASIRATNEFNELEAYVNNYLTCATKE